MSYRSAEGIEEICLPRGGREGEAIRDRLLELVFLEDAVASSVFIELVIVHIEQGRAEIIRRFTHGRSQTVNTVHRFCSGISASAVRFSESSDREFEIKGFSIHLPIQGELRISDVSII